MWAAIAKPRRRYMPERVALDRRVHEPLEPGELDDLVELRATSRRRHPEDRAVQVDVLAAR